MWPIRSILLIKQAALLYFSLFLETLATFLAEGDGVVHDPANKSHQQAQQNEKDPVFSDPQDEEFLTSRRTHWR